MFKQRITYQRPTVFPADVGPPAPTEAPCCMCNCKGTLQAILQELRAMRRLMHTQKGKWMSMNIHILWQSEKDTL